LLAAQVSSCSNAGPPSARDRPLAVHSAQADQIVATVNGVPLLVEDLKRQMRDGVSKQAGLTRLIQLELLAQEAQRRRLGRTAAVREAHNRALVHVLARQFGKAFTADKVTEALIERSYQLNRFRYVYPTRAHVSHLMVAADPRRPQEYHTRARQLAQRIRDELGALPRIDLEGLKSVFSVWKTKARDQGFRLIQEQFTRTRDSLTKPFADAAFSLKPNELSQVVRTRFGYHVVLLLELLPARNTPLAEVRDEIRQRIHPEAKRIEFQRFVEALEKQSRARVNLEILAALEQSSGP
jgi:parvulin-like peptidyl-prolyl isomerase